MKVDSSILNTAPARMNLPFGDDVEDSNQEEGLAPERPDFVIHPRTKEKIMSDDIDGLADLYESVTQQQRQIKELVRTIKIFFVAATDTEAKTRYLKGDRRKVKIEMPGPNWNQGLLKDAWENPDYAECREEVLKIDRIGVKLREFKKAVKTSGSESWTKFRDEVQAAKEEPTRSPTVSVIE